MTGHKGQRVAYIRVSSEQQNTARQDFDGLDIDRVFEEKVSGKTRDRPALIEMLRYVREGDHVFVHSMDRLGRSLVDLENLTKEMNCAGVTVEFIKERLVFAPGDDDPFAVLQRHIFSAFAQFERSMINSRQREGIEKAKAAGVYKGRKPSLSTEQIATARERIAAGVPKAAVARDLGVSRQTLYTALADLK